MTTKNLSKPFKGKINGQRLPPIPITNEQSVPITANADLPQSILKKSKPLIEGERRHSIQYDDDDDPETSRIIFQKSQADVLLLLDTYPPKTYNVPKCLTSSYNHNNMSDHNRALNPIFASNSQNADLFEAFPSPLSDRLPSSRYCRRSVSSACSRRSSILFQRQTGISVDVPQLRREESFDTLCESLTETVRQSYTPLPPIPIDSSSNLTKSLTNPTTEDLAIQVEQSADLSKSLLSIPSKDKIPSLSPPLITGEVIPAIQEKKEEFTRRLLQKSLHRESNHLSTDKTMNSPTTVHKTTIKPVIPPRIQKPVVDNRRVNSVERHPPPPPPPPLVRNKLPTAASTTSLNNLNHQRFDKIPLDKFQPHSKSTSTNQFTIKKSTTTTTGNNKTRTSIKSIVPKVKINTTISDEEIVPSNNDVIPSPSLPPPPPQPIVESTETFQVINPVQSEEISSPPENLEPVSSPTEQLKIDIPIPSKRQPSSRASSHYLHRASHPVPKPLTLQGEKIFDHDYPQTTTRAASSVMISCQRRGSKSQPVITELFTETMMETSNPIVKPEPVKPSKPSTMKPKKTRQHFLKSAKQKKQIPIVKPKPTPTASNKIEMKSQSTSTEMNENEQLKSQENLIVIGGTDWVMSVKPQDINPNQSLLSQGDDHLETVDDEDIPSCASPTDHLTTSQTTLMTSMNDTKRRDSYESDQAIEISPVLTQVIEQPIEPSLTNSNQTSQPTESPLISSDIRTVFDTVKDSIRKDASLRLLLLQATDEDKPSLTKSTSSSKNKTLPFEASTSVTHTYNNSDTGPSSRPPLRVVNDSLNSRGSETIDSTSSHEEYSTIPLCTESDCDEIYRTARKGRQIGRGAYGTVWSYLTLTGRVIAVKEIELDEGDSERVRDDYESVREEIHILRALSHPNIVKFLGISLENTRLVKIFMESLPSGTIENLLASFGPLPNDVVKKYTRQIVEGVSYLHENNVVHRDIKGKNIMLDAEGNIKLIDFGCAKRLKKNQNTHSMKQILKSMKGTANWMAPEVIAETGHGKKADIWSIGCTLCEMATGKPPWSSEHNHLAVLLIIANGTKPPADLPDTCPLSAQEFFRLCLTRDPTLRPSAKDLLKHPFLSS